jgi:RNA polymerase sigma-70 factor (ECF subfamily)
MADRAAATITSDPDRDLVRRSRGGDFDAFDQLVRRYERRVYTLGMRIVQHVQDAEEVVQETFLSVLEHLKDFQEHSLFSTWLVRIATNKALKVLERRRKHRAESIEVARSDEDQPLPHPQFIAEWRDDPLQIAEDHETMKLVNEALAELDEKYRTVFVMRDIEGLSTEETAEMLGLSVSNAKIRLLRARLALRERLTCSLGDPASRVESTHGHE